MKKYFVFWTVLLSLISPLVLAESALSVKTRAWPKTVTLGDEIRVFIQVTRLAGFTVQTPEPADVSPFELKSVRRLPSVEERGIAQENFELVMTNFKVGNAKIPPIRIFYTGPSGETGSLSTPPIDIKVVGVIPAGGGSASGGKDTTLDIRPIKNVVSLAPGLLQALILGGMALILFFILAVRVISRRKKKAAVDPEALLPAHERVALELGRLQKKEWIAAGKFKEHYSELSGILKRYLERRYAAQMLDLTTSEIIALLRAKDFDLAIRDSVKEVLEASDLVKFANWVPPRRLGDELAKKILDLVDRTKPAAISKDRKA